MIHLKVAWIGNEEKITWEPASTLPEIIVKEFEDGLSTSEETLLTKSKYGITSHTIITSQQLPAPAKRSKTDSPSVEEKYALLHHLQ